MDDRRDTISFEKQFNVFYYLRPIISFARLYYLIICLPIINQSIYSGKKDENPFWCPSSDEHDILSLQSFQDSGVGDTLQSVYVLMFSYIQFIGPQRTWFNDGSCHHPLSGQTLPLRYRREVYHAVPPRWFAMRTPSPQQLHWRPSLGLNSNALYSFLLHHVHPVLKHQIRHGRLQRLQPREGKRKRKEGRFVQLAQGSDLNNMPLCTLGAFLQSSFADSLGIPSGVSKSKSTCIWILKYATPSVKPDSVPLHDIKSAFIFFPQLPHSNIHANTQ